jgi:branched-chain amino acid transport system permease protein
MKDKSIRWGLPLLVVLIAMPAVIHDTFFLRVVTEGIMGIGLAIAFDVIAGYTGYLNFGHGVFFGLGAYTTAILMMQAHWPFALALPMGGAGRGRCLGCRPADPAPEGAYFAIATWSLSRALQQLALIMDITGGPWHWGSTRSS